MSKYPRVVLLTIVAALEVAGAIVAPRLNAGDLSWALWLGACIMAGLAIIEGRKP